MDDGASFIAQVDEETDTGWHFLANASVSGTEDLTLNFTPSQAQVKISFILTGSPSGYKTLQVKNIKHWYLTYQQQTENTLVCNGAKDNYRFGFNGKEKDNELRGLGNSINYDARLYDTRLGKPLSVDPLTKKFPMLSPYQFFSNNPIWFVDLDGKEGVVYQITMWQTTSGETQESVITEYNVGGNEDGVLYNVHNEGTGANTQYYVPTGAIIRPSPFQNWMSLQKKAWRNDWQGSIGYDAVGKHVKSTYLNTLSLILGWGELKAAWQAKNFLRVGLAITDVTLTTDNLLGGGNDETPLEHSLSPKGKIGLNGLKAAFGTYNVLKGMKDIKSGLKGAADVENLSKNIFSTGAATNDVIENGSKIYGQTKPEKGEKSEKKGNQKSGQAIYGQ